MDIDEDGDFLDQRFVCKPEHLFYVLNELKELSPMLAKCDTQTIVDRFGELTKRNEEGKYPINQETLDKLAYSFIDEAMSSLTDKGILQMSWDEEAEDFVWSLTEKGREHAKKVEKDEQRDNI
jgi:hypothetical protein